MENTKNWTLLCKEAGNALQGSFLDVADPNDKTTAQAIITRIQDAVKNGRQLTKEEQIYAYLCPEVNASTAATPTPEQVAIKNLIQDQENRNLILKMARVETLQQHAKRVADLEDLAQKDPASLSADQQAMQKALLQYQNDPVHTISTINQKRQNKEALTAQEVKILHHDNSQQALNTHQDFLQKIVDEPLNDAKDAHKDVDAFNSGEKEQNEAEKVQDEASKYWSENPHDQAQTEADPMAENAPQNKEDIRKELFGAGDNKQFEEPEQFDWAKFREEVIWKQLDKIGQDKNVADLGLDLFMIAVFEVPTAIILNATSQLRDLKKKNDEKASQNYNNAIDSNLKQRGFSRNDFISHLALKAKEWIADDSVIKGLDLSNPKKLTPYQRAHLKKYMFAQKLPRTADGKDFDFKKFTRAQRKQYRQYVAICFQAEPMHSYITAQTGVRLKKEDMAKFALIAGEMELSGGLDLVKQRQDSQAYTQRIESEKKEQALVDTLMTKDTLNKDTLDHLNLMAPKIAGNDKSAQVFNDVLSMNRDKKGAIKLTEEMRQSILEVVVRDGLENPKVIESLSSLPAKADVNTELQEQVKRWAKKRKDLLDRAQQQDMNQRQLTRAQERSQQKQTQQQTRQAGRSRS